MEDTVIEKSQYLLSVLSLSKFCAILFLVIIGAAHAAAVPGQGTWESTLQGRDLDGNPTTFEAYYDSTLDITWIADAALAASNTFGLVTGVSLGTHPNDALGLDGFIDTGGTMNWPGALFWIDAMNTANYLGFNDWRLPKVTPIDGASFNTTQSNNATTDRGWADADGWVDGSGNPTSEMGHMYYVTLGNLGICTPNDTDPGSCVIQLDWGLNNTGPFSNLSRDFYWVGLEVDTSFILHFATAQGLQNTSNEYTVGAAWAVRSGDINAIPVPAAVWHFGSGLLGLIGISRRKKAA